MNDDSNDYKVSYDYNGDKFTIYKKQSSGHQFLALSNEDIRHENHDFLQSLVNNYYEENKEQVDDLKEVHKLYSLFKSKEPLTGLIEEFQIPQGFACFHEPWMEFIEKYENGDVLYIYNDIGVLTGTSGFLIKDRNDQEKDRFVLLRS